MRVSGSEGEEQPFESIAETRHLLDMGVADLVEKNAVNVRCDRTRPLDVHMRHVKYVDAVAEAQAGREGLADYDETIARYSDLARRFKVPTNKQISAVIDSLDQQSPDWGKTQPEQFYSALAASFPD